MSEHADTETTMDLVALVGLLDSRGRLLLQERDEHAPVDPNKWSLVGRGVEPVRHPQPPLSDVDVDCREGRQMGFVEPNALPTWT